MKNNIRIVTLIIVITICFSSCNTIKYVADDELMLTENNIYVNNKKNVDDEINDYVVQRPNQQVLGFIPFPLHFYNIGNKDFEKDYEEWKNNKPGWYKFTSSVFSEKQTRGMRNFKYGVHQWFLKNGEPPVILNNQKTLQTIENLKLHYFNEGFLKADVTAKKDTIRNKKAEINYFVTTDKVFKIDTVSTVIESKVLDSIYTKNIEQSIIKTGSVFKTSSFSDEQNRLTQLYRNSGVYRFNKNAISFEADSIHSTYKSNVTLLINDSIANVPYKIQQIKNIKIHTDFFFNTKNKPIKDSVNYNGYLFLGREKLKYNPKFLLDAIFIEPNKIYKDENRELTRKHLRGLNNFRSVDIKYTELENDMLEAEIFLTPRKKYSIGTSTELTHSNIRQLGISGKLSFSNRNVFKGAEILNFSVQGSFLDSQDAAENETLLNAWEVGADISLEIPRFILPFNSNKIVPKTMSPKTTFTLGTSLQRNIGLDKQRFTGLIDYTWQTTKTKSHSFQLLNMQYIKNLNINNYFEIYESEFEDIEEIADTYFNIDLTTDTVIEFIDEYIDNDFETSNSTEYKTAINILNRYQILTEDVLVPSVAYTFTYNNSENYKDTDFSFFRARLVSSGNLTTLLSTSKDETGVKTIFNTQIAQYIKTDLEYKKFWNISRENVLAYKAFLGIAYPYKNSNSIPFSKSYFIGGPNDLRAWKIYDLGPGTTNSGLEYNVGNLKFLTSLEYRFKILNSIKGAFFVDAGNIWDISNNELTEENAKFKGINSIQDIAIGSGFGLRYDLSFILLRLDLGFKTYEPYLDNNKWFSNYNFNNTVYNFGISYPF
ncbi:BamA/TamA family outer membrane protein [Lutibacter sp. TH_r2]|uniref:translocation and assembly module lipoprotein TamL n=1 Tax=Lutibacter sp. TH_r2 TaxID=3082083 RepID=UPI002954CA2D|nr:BamA/TamA family outer membrane protein [Lutibacter sp. TH_r2]MDV7187043.1 BamA/TamA family outer membrane protein [Lutibacter sp. TH_r2]